MEQVINFMKPNEAFIKKFVDGMGVEGVKLFKCFDCDYDLAICLVRMIYEGGDHAFDKAYDMVFYDGAFNEMCDALMVEVDKQIA